MDRVKRSRIGQFNAHVKCAQIENSPSYCVNACDLQRSERALMKVVLALAISKTFFVRTEPPPEVVRGSNPVIGKKLYCMFTVNCIEKTKIKKEAGIGPF